MKADLHIHSTYSYDSIAKPESILSAAAEKNIGIIAITDHETTQSWAEFKHLEKYYPVQVVLGQEIKIRQEGHSVGELLCLFLEKPVNSHSVQGIMQESHAQGGITALAHPFCRQRGEFKAYYEIEDWQNLAIETRNGRVYNERDNEMAQILAEQVNSAIVAGSDAHTPFEVGSVFTEFDGKNINDLKNAIIAKETHASGEASTPFFSILSGFGRFGLAL